MSHVSVLLEPTVAALLEAGSEGVFVDCTFGRGGHSRELLKHLSENARLVVFDKDPEAVAVARALAEEDSRVTVVWAGFAQLQSELEALGVSHVQGIMADLGVSSPQLDEARRGFSFQKAGPLDMRMNPEHGKPVSELLYELTEEELANVLYEFGEERHSRRIARAIKDALPLTSTLELAEVIKTAHPKWEKRIHPATKSFQALRIYVNNELGELDTLLKAAEAMLATGGVLAVISFHSLEDRRVKQFFKEAYQPEADLFGVRAAARFSKPVRLSASDAESKENARARSAWLRHAKKL